jgi:hypothetical protein
VNLDDATNDLSFGESTDRNTEARVRRIEKLLADTGSFMGSLTKGAATPITSFEAGEALMLEGIARGPLASQMQRVYGPNWMHHREELKRLAPADTVGPEEPIAPAEIKSMILERTNGIIQFWKELQSLERNGTLDRLSKSWTACPQQTRERLLLQKFPNLPKSSVSYIVEWAQGSKRQGSNEPHFSPLLNEEDLTVDCTLPSLFNTRAGLHPLRFHSVDGRLVMFRLFTGSLAKLPTTGKLKFGIDENNENADHYRIDLLEESSDIEVHPDARSLYKFLASFPVFLLDHCNDAHIHDIEPSVTDSFWNTMRNSHIANLIALTWRT